MSFAIIYFDNFWSFCDYDITMLQLLACSSFHVNDLKSSIHTPIN
jgi:hypothetical protein